MTELIGPGAGFGWGAVIAFFAALVQAATGVGFSLIATPLFLLIYDAHTAIQLNIVLGMAISVAMLPKVARATDPAMLRQLALGALAGAPIGGAIFLCGGDRALTLGIAVVTLVLAVVSGFTITLRRSPRRDFAVGASSGALAASIGVPGPPLMFYLAGSGAERQVARATTLAFFLITYTGSLAFQVAGNGFANGLWGAFGICLPLALLGVVAGQLAFGIINQRAFVLLIRMLLILTGLSLLHTLL